jgi:DNA-binding IclR family transcriptional regulator
MKNEKKGKKIQSVTRATAILCLFNSSRPRLGISEIGLILGLNKGTVQGLVNTLLQQGFLQQDKETRKYSLGSIIYELGVNFSRGLEINQKGSGPAHELAKKTAQLVHIAILEEDSALITLTAYPRSEPELFYLFGPRIPLHCTALGKALLAFMGKSELEVYIEKLRFIPYTPNTIMQKDQLSKDLEETKHRGCSINREEHMLARTSIGAPIFGRGGRISASISLGGDSRFIVGEELERLSREVMITASRISRFMGYFPEVTAFERRDSEQLSSKNSQIAPLKLA